MKDQYKILIFSLLMIGFFSYTFLLYNENSSYSSITISSSDQGKKIWQEKNCIACHQIYGLGGYLGPDLTNTYSEKGESHIVAFLRNGTQIMPNFQFTENEIENLSQYLKNIDKSGIGRPSKLKINYNGTIEQPQKNNK